MPLKRAQTGPLQSSISTQQSGQGRFSLVGLTYSFRNSTLRKMRNSGSQKRAVQSVDSGNVLEMSGQCAINAFLRGQLMDMVFKLKDDNGGNLQNCALKAVERLIGRYALFLFRLGHLLITAMIWFHFFYGKFIVKKQVPEGAPNYWWKRIVPPTEFGLMHAILFQLVLLPLTMCRHLLAQLGKTFLKEIIPFEHITSFHIFLGYVFCSVMVGSVILFVVFFGKVCSDHNNGKDPTNLCEKFTEEIMLTGYGILASTLIVLFSSYFRGRLPYEVFYFMHHFVFVMFALAVAHTMDAEWRNGSKTGMMRSQNMRWFSTPLVIYLADRIWANFAAQRRVPVKYLAKTVDCSTVVLVLKRPSNFKFCPGQHAFLQIPSIDYFWHPFSISSCPANSTELGFMLEVKGPGSWTHKLINRHTPVDDLKVNVMGPFGTGVGNDRRYHKIMAIGTGTGIVPMFSLMKDVSFEKRELPVTFASRKEDAFRETHLQWRIKMVRKYGHSSAYVKMTNRLARLQRIRMALDAIIFISILFELWVFFVNLSWPNLRNRTPMSEMMATILEYTMLVTILNYTWLYAARLLVVTPGQRSSYVNVFEVLFIGAMIVTWCIWKASETAWRFPDPLVQLVRGVLSIWRLTRLWQSNPWARLAHSHADQDSQCKFELIWSTRSANLLMGYVGEIELMLQRQRDTFSVAPALLQKYFNLQVYCTDTDPTRCARLQKLLKGSLLEELVFFDRPDLQALINKMSVETIRDFTKRKDKGAGTIAPSLVTFCGSPAVADLCRAAVLKANLYADESGMSEVPKMIFREEFYGLASGAAVPRQANRSSRLLAPSMSSNNNVCMESIEESKEVRKIEHAFI